MKIELDEGEIIVVSLKDRRKFRFGEEQTIIVSAKTLSKVEASE